MNTLIDFAYNRFLSLLLFVMLLPLTLLADNDTANDSITEDQRPLLLIINSYNETRQGVIDIEPIVKAASEHKVRVNLEHIEISRVRNDSIYNVIANALFKKYAAEHPDYVVVSGGIGTTFINRIRQEWGDQIPIVFVGITENVGKREDYFTGVENYTDFSTWQSIDTVYQGANLLYVAQPYFPEKTVDLMVSTVPDLEEIMFIGDGKWINRYLDNRLRSYVKKTYPRVKYEWVICDSPAKRDDVNRSISTYKEGRGFILSTWCYERPSLLGFPVLVIQDYNSIATSPNPVFALTPMYMDLGAIGGHFYDEELFSRNVRSAMDHMISDEYLDTIPNITVEKGVNMINYDRYNVIKDALGHIPDDVIVLNEPPTFWARYKWIIIISLIIIGSIVLIMHIINRDQRSKAIFFRQLDTVVQSMPVAFMTVNVKLGEKNRIESYEFGRMNDRYRSILLENNFALRKGKVYEETRDLLISCVQRAFLLPADQAVTYTKYFPKTGKTYEWLFKRDLQAEKCYVYGVDISELAASRRKLASTKSQLEIALLSARLIPWIWDIAGKRLAYDRIRAKKNSSASIDEEVTMSRRGYIDNRRLVKLIHPDDRIILARNFNDLSSGKIKSWEGNLRIADTTADVPGLYHNAKITALALETDERGKVLTISGAILIDRPVDEKPQTIGEDAKANTSGTGQVAETSKDIIIVEPYETNYLLYEAILSKDYKLHRVGTLQDTARLLDRIVPGLVMINVDTGEHDDIFEIFEFGYGRYPQVPVVALTSHATSLNALPEHIRKCFVAVLTLPITPRNLIHEITRLLHP